MRALAPASVLAVLAAFTALVGCAAPPKVASLPAAPPPSASAATPAAPQPAASGSWIPAAASPDPVEAPIAVDGIGVYRRAVSHADAESQRWFDQGLNLLYGFNRPEAIRDFTQAAARSPSCAMCFWGIAYTYGPYINEPALSEKAARSIHAALAQARAVADQASPVEQALIAALATRHADPEPKDRAALDAAYAEAMRRVRKAFPADVDVAALTAEALMDLHPWDLQTKDGQPKPWTPEILDAVQAALALGPRHPLALHLHVHALEASADPGRALPSADALRDLEPDVGHMLHMPSHIDVRLGHWDAAIESNRKAIDADMRYRTRAAKVESYVPYTMHNRQMLAFAALMSGRSAEAIAAARAAVQDLPDDKHKELTVDPYNGFLLEVLVRFGRWDEILAIPDFPVDMPAARAFLHESRAIALAVSGKRVEARAEVALFEAARALVPADQDLSLNKTKDVLEIAAHLMNGEVLVQEGKTKEGIAELQRAVAAEDALRYDEPPSWIQPVRHALGATLAQGKQYREAEAVFRDDLARNPNNGWALLGLSRVLRLHGQTKEADGFERQFNVVWSKADVKIHSACMCQPGV